MSLFVPATSTPVIAGEFEAIELPTCVVLIQAVIDAVPPNVLARFKAVSTDDCCVGELYTPLPLKLKAAAPVFPGVTQAGSGEPFNVAAAPPAAFAVMVPPPSSNGNEKLGPVTFPTCNEAALSKPAEFT